MSWRISSAVFAGAVVLCTVGCAQAIPGRAIAKSPQIPVMAASTAPADFDPCTDISDSVLRYSEIDPSTVESVPGDDEGCAWFTDDDAFAIGVFSYDISISSALGNPHAIIDARTTIGGRPALIGRYADNPNSSCFAMFEGGRGVVLVEAVAVDPDAQNEQCAEALLHARDLVDEIPAA